MSHDNMRTCGDTGFVCSRGRAACAAKRTYPTSRAAVQRVGGRARCPRFGRRVRHSREPRLVQATHGMLDRGRGRHAIAGAFPVGAAGRAA